MKFSLKSLKIVASLSNETTCYTATLLIDDEPAFACSNRGHGGCDQIYPIGRYSAADIEHHIRENTPPGVTLYDFSSPIECLLDHLIEVENAGKMLKRRLKTGFVFIENGGVHVVKPANGRPFTEEWAKAVAAHFPERKRITLTSNWDEAITIITAPPPEANPQ